MEVSCFLGGYLKGLQSLSLSAPGFSHTKNHCPFKQYWAKNLLVAIKKKKPFEIFLDHGEEDMKLEEIWGYRDIKKVMEVTCFSRYVILGRNILRLDTA